MNVADMSDEERLRQRALMLKACPHFGFEPNPPQYKFLRAFESGYADGKRKFLATWANRTGKTTLWAQMMWALMGPPEQRIKWFNFDPINNWTHPRRARIICDSVHLREGTGGIWKAIDECWPKGCYQTKKQGYEYPSLWEVPQTGWLMDARTEDQPKSGGESVELGVLIVEEKCEEVTWQRASARFSKGGIRMMFATLLEESEWIENTLMVDPLVVWFFAKDHENCSACSRMDVQAAGQTYQLKGYLDHDIIEANAKDYPINERATRTTGVPIFRHGRVFQVSDEHFIRRNKAEGMWKDGKLTTYLAVDPHQLRPWFIVVGGIDGDGNWFMLDEWPRENYTRMDSCHRGIAEYARLIDSLEKKWNVREKIIDAKFANQQMRFDTMARTLAQELLLAHGLYFAPGVVNPEVEGNGVTKLQELLAFDPERPIEPGNRPRFYLVDDLDNCRVSLRNITKKFIDDPTRGRTCERLDPKYLDPVRCCMYLVTHGASHNPLHSGTAEAVSKREAIEADLRNLGVEGDQISDYIAEAVNTL